MTENKKHYPVKRIDSDMGLYEYRGFEIERDDRVPTGYYGRYTVRGTMKGGWTTDYLWDCKRIVDEYIERREDDK